MKKKLFLLFLAGAAFTACKKDKNGTGDGGGAAVTRYLTSVTEKEEGGSTTTQQFNWDAQNRLAGRASAEGGKRTIAYDAAGRVSKLRAERDEESIVDEYTFTYTAAGLPEKFVHRVRDSENGTDVTSHGTYTITGGKVTMIREKNPDQDDEVFFKFTYTGNNVTKISVMTGRNGTPDPLSESSVTLTYGTKRNPLGGMKLPYLLLGTDLLLEGFSENETKTLTMQLGDVSFTSATVYKYDAAGYPVSAETREEDSNEVMKVTFQYK